MGSLLRSHPHLGSLWRVVALQCRKNVAATSAPRSNFTKRLLHVSSPARSQSTPDHTMRDMIRPSDFDKKVLVWTKKYPAIDKVPEEITPQELKKARDLMRIRVNIGMLFATLFGCIIAIVWGRRLQKSGDSLNKRGQEWERQMKEQGRREREAATLAVNK